MILDIGVKHKYKLQWQAQKSFFSLFSLAEPGTVPKILTLDHEKTNRGNNPLIPETIFRSLLLYQLDTKAKKEVYAKYFFRTVDHLIIPQ